MRYVNNLFAGCLCNGNTTMTFFPRRRDGSRYGYCNLLRSRCVRAQCTVLLKIFNYDAYKSRHCRVSHDDGSFRKTPSRAAFLPVYRERSHDLYGRYNLNIGRSFMCIKSDFISSNPTLCAIATPWSTSPSNNVLPTKTRSLKYGHISGNGC